MNSKNQLIEIIHFLEKLVEERPKQVAIRRRLGEVYKLSGNLDQAVEQLDEVKEILLESGDRVGAIAAVQRIVEFNPSEVEDYKQILNQLQSDL
jgi:hypothetical protein